MKTYMKMSRDIVNYINDEKGKINLEVYREFVGHYSLKHAKFVALPAIGDDQLAGDYKNYLL